MRGQLKKIIDSQLLPAISCKLLSILSSMKTKKQNVDESMSENDMMSTSKNYGAFFVFMEQFRNENKENVTESKSNTDVVKEAEVIWKSMSDSEKAPYIAKAAKMEANDDLGS